MLPTPKRRGRPPKPDDQRLDVVLTTRVSTADHLRIKALAEAAKMSVAEWIAAAARAAIRASGRSTGGSGADAS